MSETAIILLIISVLIPALMFIECYRIIKFVGGVKSLITFFASAIGLIVVIRSIRLVLEYYEEPNLRMLNDLILPVVILLLFYIFTHKLRVIFCKTFRNPGKS